MPIKVNFLEQTAETQISKQKAQLNPYAVFHQIVIFFVTRAAYFCPLFSNC